MYLLELESAKVQVLRLTFDFDIQHFWVNAEGQVARQCPGCGGPGDQCHLLILNQWEVDDDRRVLNVLEAKNGPKWVNFMIYVSEVNFITSSALERLRCERVCANLVVLVGLKVGQGRVAGGGEGHDFDPSVNQTLVVELFKHPPE